MESHTDGWGRVADAGPRSETPVERGEVERRGKRLNGHRYVTRDLSYTHATRRTGGAKQEFGVQRNR